MFDIGWSELLVIGIVALVVIGPKELPAVLRKIGQGVGKLRRMAGEFQGQFNEALREAELSEFKDNITGFKNDLGNLASDARTSLANAMPTNPLHDIEDSMKAPTGAVESTELPAGDIEAQLPQPTELEVHPFESIEDEVRAAAANLPPVAPGVAKAADAKPAENTPVATAKPAEVVPPAPEKPKPAPRRKAAAATEPEVAAAVAALDGPAADAKPAVKPRARAKAEPGATKATRPRITRKPGGSTSGNEGPQA
ncbi:Sec-independent protein translocase protein TatB [Ancylobacter sp. VNQ12]|uniref:Sec-independent protein translocase protein TatB n=1 Tax=Ancylobacter sp. VNQ12 TaxID=3400920 RepID=UPI003C11EB39